LAVQGVTPVLKQTLKPVFSFPLGLYGWISTTLGQPNQQPSRIKVQKCGFMYDKKLTDTNRLSKNRRSQRIELNVPVVVYRPRGEGPQFYENTQTLVISAHGALVALTDMVTPRQKLQVQNPDSGEHLECRVVTVKKELIGPPTVAVEFTQPAPSFWRIAFPPADWKA
jgi:hypothetical protein